MQAMEVNRTKLIQLSDELYQHTRTECANCRVPHSCCDVFSCEDTREYARQHWGIELEDTGHEELPFMGKNGCVVAPHLRPICTRHTCDINSLGFKRKDDVNQTWTNRYFQLRNQINEIASELKMEE